MKNIIEQKLTDEFKPEILEVINESYKHAGHMESRMENKGLSETHFLIKIKSNSFKNVKLLDAHKLIYLCLKSEIKEKIHALSIKIEK